MVSRKSIGSILDDYEDIVVATVCSHSSLQIFHGARQEGFRTLGIAIGQRPRFYDAFPLAKPDEFLIVDSYADILDHADDLVARQVVTVPHGSFVEYMGSEVFAKLRIPTFGNRDVLRWESDREKQREWLTSAGVPMPGKVEGPEDIVGPFCLETIVTDHLEFKVFEISTRIVAGTNLFIAGSPYADLREPGMSTGRRIAREIQIARKLGRLKEILS